MSEEMDRMLRGTGGTGGARMFQPAVEVLQRNNQFIIRAELPGLRRDDIDIEILEDAVVLQGEKHHERQEDDQERGLYRSEWTYGRFYREIPLPPGARQADATARFERGVLEITVPVQQDVARPRRLQIEGDDQQGQQRTEGRAGTKTENRGRGDRPEDRGGQDRERQENRGDARGI
jgi:HSP20 family protein